MLVSIVVPVYNAEKFLSSCIKSVLSQTYNKLELILVNDSSTDSSLKICEKFAVEDSRVKVISQKNGGPASARNKGVEFSNGEFIFFLDADDLIANDCIESLILAYNKENADLVLSNFCKLEEDGTSKPQPVAFTLENNLFTAEKCLLSKKEVIQFIRHFFKYPSNHLISYCWARLYKSSIIKEHNIKANTNMRMFEDFVFTLEYLMYSEKLLFINKPLYTYRMHSSHVSLSMSIIQSNSLINDMSIFKERVEDFFNKHKTLLKLNYPIIQEFGHTLIHYSIIFLIRTSRLVNNSNKSEVSKEILTLINSDIYKKSLVYYRPQPGNSKLLPFLTKYKLVNAILFYCKMKANRRYGRMEDKNNGKR